MGSKRHQPWLLKHMKEKSGTAMYIDEGDKVEESTGAPQGFLEPVSALKVTVSNQL